MLRCRQHPKNCAGRPSVLERWVPTGYAVTRVRGIQRCGRVPIRGYTFHSGAIYYPSPLGVYLVCSDDLYDGGVITLEDACAYGIADAAQHLCGAAGKLSGRNAGYADRGCTVGRPGAAAGARSSCFRQEGCTLPADAAVREYGDILFVDTGVAGLRQILGLR